MRSVARAHRSVKVLVAAALAFAACASGETAEPPAIDVTRPPVAADGAPAASGACIDAVATNGTSTIAGNTPLGAFTAAGAQAFGRCLWLQFTSVRTVDGRRCQGETITAATGLRVPPWFEGSRLAVGISLAGDAMSAPLVASGTLTIDTVVEPDGAAILKGTLVSQQPGWTLEGSFEAPWTDVPCR